MAEKTGVDRLDNLVNELLQQNTNVAPDTVGAQPTETLPLSRPSGLADMTMESPEDDTVANADLIRTDLARKLNVTDLTKSDSPAVGKKADSDVEEVDPDHDTVKRKLNFTDLTKSDSPAVGKKADSDVEEVDPDHDTVKRKLNFTDLTKSDSPAVGKKADSDVEEVDPDHDTVKRKLNFTDLTKSDSPAVGKKADSDVEELDPDHEKVREMVMNTFTRPAVLRNFYCFQGARTEFAQRTTDQQTRRESCLKTFKNLEKDGYGELELFNLRNWYKELRFSNIDTPVEDQERYVWHFHFIMLYPRASTLKEPKNKEREKVHRTYLTTLSHFYRKAFSDTKETQKSITLALQNDISFMIVGVRCKHDVVVQSSFSSLPTKAMKIVAAVTFSMSHRQGLKDRNKLALFLSWVNVSDTTTPPPPTTTGSWRRQGFSLFLLKCMIKYAFCCGSSSSSAEVDMYLQCYDTHSFQFYSMLGFSKMNRKYDDGFDSLPDYLQTSLKSRSKSKNRGESLFHYFQPDNESSVETEAYSLMRLHHGCLQHVVRREKGIGNTETKKVTYKSMMAEKWCQYPPPMVRSVRLKYSQSKMTKLFHRLPLLKELLPPPYDFSCPISSLLAKGEMTVEKRLDHTGRLGTKWIATGELDLLLSTILWDGRYNNWCFVVLSSYQQLIKAAYKAYFDYKCAWAMHDEEKKNGMEVVELYDKIVKRFHHSLPDLGSRYQQARKNVETTIVYPNRGLLSRRLLVFPINENNSHWSSVFVFNASFIEEDVPSDHTSNTSVLRPCFLRYCGLSPTGQRDTLMKCGCVWFLNLCFSIEVHEREHGLLSDETLAFIEPFGCSIGTSFETDLMLGTPQFPALHLPPGSNVLPFQHDNYNCGVAVPCAVAIILRDVIIQDTKVDHPEIEYAKYFSAKELPLQVCDRSAESYCNMPLIWFNSLPTKTTLVWDHYLAMVREQWFLMLDKLAELQHKIQPLEDYKDYQVSMAYSKYADMIRMWPYTMDDPRRKAGGSAPYLQPETTHDSNDMNKANDVNDQKDKTKDNVNDKGDRMDESKNSDDGVKDDDAEERGCQDNVSDEENQMEEAKYSEHGVKYSGDAEMVDDAKERKGQDNVNDKGDRMDESKNSDNGVKEDDAEERGCQDNVSDEENQIEEAKYSEHGVKYSGDAEMVDDAKEREGQDNVNDEGDQMDEGKESDDGVKVDNAEARGGQDNVNDEGDQKFPPQCPRPKVFVNKELVNLEFTSQFYDQEFHVTKPIPFTTQKCMRPLKRTIDSVEGHAQLLLKKIKVKNPKDAAELLKDCSVEPEVREICIQSVAMCDAMVTEFGTEMPPQTVLDPHEYNKELEAYIENSFIEWKWHSNKQHEKELKKWEKKLTDTKKPLSDMGKTCVILMIKAMRNERAKFRKHFTNHFQCTQKTLVRSVRFVEETNSFTARLQWIEKVPIHGPNEMKTKTRSKDVLEVIGYKEIQREDDIPVMRSWLVEQFGSKMVQQVVNMRHESLHSWVKAPRDVEIFIGKEKVVRVRYIPDRVMNVVDMEKLSEVVTNELNAYAASAPSSPAPILSSPINQWNAGRNESTPTTTPTKLRPSNKPRPLPLRRNAPKEIPAPELLRNYDVEPVPESIPFVPSILANPPRMPLPLSAKWTGKTLTGKIVPLEEAFVRMVFGDNFANELMKLNRGFVDIPVGDYKPSRLAEHPNLKIIGGPTVNFVQSEGKDLCVSKSLASAFYALGWHTQSFKIDEYGEEVLKGLVMKALDHIADYTKSLFPPWLKISLIPRKFDWRTDLLPTDVMMGVMVASDGSCSHAITVHGGFIFDANEHVALPLCPEALDYCTSTALINTTFVGFKRAWLYRYHGKQTNRIARMTLTEDE